MPQRQLPHRQEKATGRAQRDISPDIKGALKPHHGKLFVAITDPAKLGGLIRVIRGYQGGLVLAEDRHDQHQ